MTRLAPANLDELRDAIADRGAPAGPATDEALAAHRAGTPIARPPADEPN